MRPRSLLRRRQEMRPRDHVCAALLLRVSCVGILAAAALGGNHGLLISAGCELEPGADHDLLAEFTVRAEQRVHLSIQWFRPEAFNGNTFADGWLEPALQ